MTGIWLISYIALWLFCGLIAVIQLIVLRKLGLLHQALEASQGGQGVNFDITKLALNHLLPDIDLVTLAGEPTSVSRLRGAQTAISIINPTCEPCRELLTHLAQRLPTFDMPVVMPEQVAIISLGDRQQTADLVQTLGLPEDIPVMVDATETVRNTWGIMMTPATVIVDDQLRVVHSQLGWTSIVSPQPA